jgi:hypothetical protein
MKTKCLVLGCFIAAILSTSALAVSVDVQVTPAHVREHPKEWSVEVTKGEDGLIHFTVKHDVETRTYHVAHLAVYHQSKLIARSDTPSFGTKGWNTFYFSLSPEDVAESKFALGENYLGGGDLPAAGTTGYQFKLSDFVPEQLLNAVLHASDETPPRYDADNPKPGKPIDDEKLQRLAWGSPATNGLRAACYFEPTQEAYSDGEVVERWKVFHNSGKEPVLFTVGGGDYRWSVVDQQDRKVPLDQVAAYGRLLLVTYRLEPGQVAEIKCSSVGMGPSTKAGDLADTAIQAKPGTACRVRWEELQVAETTRMRNGKAVPVAGVWHGSLTTGEVRFRIVGKGGVSR